MDYRELLTEAQNARKNAYAKYSGFKVGAALLAGSGRVYVGCNIENASFGATICAERTAFAKAISEGESSFRAIAIVGGEQDEKCFPCGICRQIMAEHCAPDFEIVVGSPQNFCVYKLSELLPQAFRI